MSVGPGPTGSPNHGWTPKLVALDIDGTLLKWVEGAGTTHEEISPAVDANDADVVDPTGTVDVDAYLAGLWSE